MRRTTIQVKSDLLVELDEVKREVAADSYDAAIRELLREHRRLPKTAFGRFPKLPAFTREEIDRLD